MYTIEKLDNQAFLPFAPIFYNAYPGVTQPFDQYTERLLWQNDQDYMQMFGVFQDGVPAGAMRMHYFRMNMRGQMIDAGGVGSIAVDLAHKKQKVAYEIMQFFLNHFIERKAPVAILYPFNHAFYKKMGFGFGTSVNQFHLFPRDLPKGPGKAGVSRAYLKDAKELCDYYNTVVARTHGLMLKSTVEFEEKLGEEGNKVFTCRTDGRITGYLHYVNRRAPVGAFLRNDMFLHEFLYDDPDTFSRLMTFLHSQDDQYKYIFFNTQDENLRFVLQDPRNHSERMVISVFHECSIQGTGTMYRIIDLPLLLELLKDCNFGGVSVKLKLNLTDTFLPRQNRSYYIHFKDGFASLADGGSDVELSTTIDHFSELMMGSADLRSLARYGVAQVSDAHYLETLNTAFASCEKPTCLTTF